MSVRLEEPSGQELSVRSRRRYGSVLLPAGAVVTAAPAAVCLLQGLSYPGFPTDLAALGVLAAHASTTLAIASGVQARPTGRSKGRAVAILAAVALILGVGAVAAYQDRYLFLQAKGALTDDSGIVYLPV